MPVYFKSIVVSSYILTIFHVLGKLTHMETTLVKKELPLFVCFLHDRFTGTALVRVGVFM